MKHLFSFLIAFACTTSLFAYDCKVNGIYYVLNSNKTATVTFNQGSHYAGDVVIPSTIYTSGQTYTVTKIGSSAFAGCTDLTSISIPNSVTEITVGAFSGCTSLPVKDNIRYADTYLVEAVDKTLSTYTITEGTRWIGWNAFSQCTNLTSISIPNSVTRIELRAFSGCSSLSSITISKSVAYIGEEAFSECSNLSSIISESESLIEFKRTAFQKCNNILHVTFKANSMCRFERIYEYFGPQVLEYIFGDAVFEIGEYFFAGCMTLTSISLPNSVKKIGKMAFYDCYQLDSVYLGNSVEEIGESAFSRCPILRSINIPNSIKTIGGNAFGGNKGLLSLDIPPMVTAIGENAFYGVNNINYYGSATGSPWGAKCINGYIENDLVYSDKTKTKVCGCSTLAKGAIVIPNTVTSIGERAFAECKNISSIIIGTAVTTIEEDAFYECYLDTIINLSSLPIKKGSSNYGYVAFGASYVLTGKLVGDFLVQNDTTLIAYLGNELAINIPEGITKIEDNAFYNKYDLQSVVMNKEVKYVGNEAFYRCRGLKSVEFGNSICSIGYNAFYDCNHLRAITLGDSIKKIESQAFSYCTSLQSVSIGKALSELGIGAFQGCSQLKNISLGTSLATIEQSVFEGCNALESIALPNTISNIGPYAFKNCSALTSINIPNAVTIIYNGAFYGCSNLSNVSLPQSLIALAEKAFYGCSSIRSITLGDKIIRIWEEVFHGCNNLRQIICYASTPPICVSNSFTGLSQYMKTYVLASFLEDYQFAVGWRDLTLLPIGADEQPIEGSIPIIIPTDNSVTITWPITDGTNTYTLTITKGSEVVCVLTFNANGQLTNIAFAAPCHDGSRQAPAATLTAQGYQFTVTGLTPGTSYEYSVVAADAEGETIAEHTGNFSTTGGATTNINQTQDTKHQTLKYLHNGQLIIDRNGQHYSAMGERIR